MSKKFATSEENDNDAEGRHLMIERENLLKKVAEIDKKLQELGYHFLNYGKY